MAKKSFYKIEMLFLKVLEQEDCYGYQLRQVKVGKRQTRVYYHLEPAGKEYLSQLTHDYYQMIDAIQAVLGPRK